MTKYRPAYHEISIQMVTVEKRSFSNDSCVSFV